MLEKNLKELKEVVDECCDMKTFSAYENETDKVIEELDKKITNCYTKAESDSKIFGNTYTKAEVSVLLAQIYKKDEANNQIMTTLTTNCYTRAQMDTKLAEQAKTIAELTNVVNALNAKVTSLHTRQEIDVKFTTCVQNSTMNNYYTKSDSDGKYTPTGTAYTKQELEQKLVGYAPSATLGAYLQKEEAKILYAPLPPKKE